MKMFKTDDAEIFNSHILFLIKEGVTFTSYTSGDYYIIEYTGGY